MSSWWHKECLERCEECTSSCPHKKYCSRFMSIGPVRYGMRIGAVSPPPPGAGPRYRTQCCWPSCDTASGSRSACDSSSVSRIPLLYTTPINSLDIISGASRMHDEWLPSATSLTSEEPPSRQQSVRSSHHVRLTPHNAKPTKCLLKNPQLKRCALVRPQVYHRLAEYSSTAVAGADSSPSSQDHLNNTLDRLPRFRFGGNRAAVADLTDRLKRTPVPIPPPRTRHPTRVPTPEEVKQHPRVPPLRSASFTHGVYDPPQPMDVLLDEPPTLVFDPPSPTITDKKRDKSRRRKGIYLSQWPHVKDSKPEPPEWPAALFRCDSQSEDGDPESKSDCESSPKRPPYSPQLLETETKKTEESPRRKVSAEEPKLVVSHQRTISSPSKLEGFVSSNEVSNELLEQLLRGSSEQLATTDANLQQQNDTRTHVVVELYENEISYVESLQIIVTKYLEPLKSPENATLLDGNLVDEIFYQIPFLLSHHQAFLDELKKRLEHWDIKQKIGDVFLDMFSKPSVIENYTNYVNNWKRGWEILKNAQQSKPAFSRFLEITAREHKGKLALDSLLIKPIQKFPKYELLLQRLIKHTCINHPDHSLLLSAQRQVHEQLLKINCTERETLELEQLREIEGLIEGLIDLASSDRQYIRNDLVTMIAEGGARKERALFLFSDLLLITSIKRRSGTIRRPAQGQGAVTSALEANKYKLLMKISLDDLEIVKAKDDNQRQMIIEVENLTEDIAVLNQINELCWSLHCNHSQLDEVVKEMLVVSNKQLLEQHNSDSQMSQLDLTINTTNGLESISIVFSKTDKRSSWEESFTDAKQKLSMSGERKPCPELLATVPIRKTRAGLQFTCAAPTLGDNRKDVWVCNSDGYVGQVCVLSLQPEPTVTSCNGVCNAKILCVASVPGINNGGSSAGSSQEAIRLEGDEHKGIQFDSGSSSDEEEKSPGDDKDKEELRLLEQHAEVANCVEAEESESQSTMWLGTEDGFIHVYNSSDNIRIKKNKIKLQHSSSILSIIYLDNRVFVSLANGDLCIYDRDNYGAWNVNVPTNISVGTATTPVSKLVPSTYRLWCGFGSTIKVYNTATLEMENCFSITNDNNKQISCIVLGGNAVWLSLQNSAVVKCFHGETFEHLCEINVAPAVTKMLTSCDDIIRQHKAACLRVTALVACKDLLWIGTSAGVLLTMPLPHVTATTTKLSTLPPVSGVSHGHTGHVRFLTCVEMHASSDNHRHSYKGKEPRTNSRLLVISGGDGYEDFRTSNISEVAGREDSTNHLLLWNI